MTSPTTTSARTVPRGATPAHPGTGRSRTAARRPAPPRDGRDRRRKDPARTWLVVVRAAVLPMTLLAGLVAGLLGVRAPGFSWPLFLLALLGGVLAHVCSNLMDDLADPGAGRGVGLLARGSQAPHPLLAGTVRRRSMGLTVLGLHLALAAIVAVLALHRGWPVVAFAAAAVVLSLAASAPPLRLKARGLGELSVLVVWGPVAVAGTHLAAVGTLPWQVWLAGVPYGLLCATVALGRHLDELDRDAAAGVRTLPVRLGESGARTLTIALLVAGYAGTGLAVALGALPWPALLIALALPLLREVAAALRQPRQDGGPAGPEVGSRALGAQPGGVQPGGVQPGGVQPLGSLLLVHLRRAGSLLVLGLLTAAVLRTGLPLAG